MTAYRRMILYDRRKIEEGLQANLSFRKIAQLIERNTTSVSREVKTNRHRKEGKDFSPRKSVVRMPASKKNLLCPATELADIRIYIFDLLFQ